VPVPCTPDLASRSSIDVSDPKTEAIDRARAMIDDVVPALDLAGRA